jgi:hypothetical protein
MTNTLKFIDNQRFITVDNGPKNLIIWDALNGSQLFNLNFPIITSYIQTENYFKISHDKKQLILIDTSNSEANILSIYNLESFEKVKSVQANVPKEAFINYEMMLNDQAILGITSLNILGIWDLEVNPIKQRDLQNIIHTSKSKRYEHNLKILT